MQLVKQISAIILGMIFLISSSGFIMYKSHCACTGDKQVTFFVQNEICNSDESTTCCENMVTSCCETDKINQCEPHSNDCECDKPEVTYVKLEQKVVNEEVKFTNIEPIEILVLYATVNFNLWEIAESDDFNCQYNNPPPNYDTSLELLIQIQQLKIPSLA